MFPPALCGKVKVGIVALVVAAVLTACSQTATSHTTSSSGPPVVVLTTPIPSASPTLAHAPSPSPSPSVIIPSATPRPITAGTVNWSTRVYLTVLDRYHQRLTITVVDAHGIQR